LARAELLDRPEAEVGYLLLHPVQQQAVALIADLVAELRSISPEAVDDLFEFQRELAAQIVAVQQAQIESAWDPWRLHTLEVRMEHGEAPVAEAVSA